MMLGYYFRNADTVSMLFLFLLSPSKFPSSSIEAVLCQCTISIKGKNAAYGEAGGSGPGKIGGGVLQLMRRG